MTTPPAPPTAVSPPGPLQELAAAYGVDTEYYDWRGEHRQVADSTLHAVLAALHVDASTPQACVDALTEHRRRRDEPGLPPCVVLRQGQTWAGQVGGPVRLVLEDGSARRLDAVSGRVELPTDLPLGYHHLIREPATGPSATDPAATDPSATDPSATDPAATGPSATNSPAAAGSAALIVTPARLDWPARLPDPGWGFATQLYSVRSSDSWGIGDLADLGRLAAWSAREHGADFVLVNPVHAAEAVPPIAPSPYLPTSRRFANPMYLRVERTPEYAGSAAALRSEIDAMGARVRADAADEDLLDRDASWAAKRAALERLHAADPGPVRRAVYADYLAREGEQLQAFATWSVLCEQHGADWRTWPPELRTPGPAATAAVAGHRARVDFHCWVQWLLAEQLLDVHDQARAAGMRLGVIHDVAVGVSPAGADAWTWSDVMATAVTVGAPPDAYSQRGQDWQQPPWRPDRLVATAYAPLREMFRAALRHSGGLRVDHIVGLFRLWWIPDGAGADAGTYVRYDHEALIGILALEAHRAGAIVIGEDLGNVEPSAREYLRDRGLLGTSILWFESDPSTGGPLAPQRWRQDCLASVTTHDLPPTTGYLHGDHVRLRAELGLLTRPLEDELAADRHDQGRWIDELVRLGLLADSGADERQIVLALHEALTLSPARLRCVALTDAVGERRTQNQPGTDAEYPNWRIPLGGPDGRAVLLDDVVRDPRAGVLADSVRAVAPRVAPPV